MRKHKHAKIPLNAALRTLAAVAVVMSMTVFGNFAHAAGKKEKEYVAAWCAQQGGASEFILPDNSRPDCVLEDIVVEFDFGEGMKPYECAGQALHYARLTGKSPLCILIHRPGVSAGKFSRAVGRVAAPVRCMDGNGAIFACPERER